MCRFLYRCVLILAAVWAGGCLVSPSRAPHADVPTDGTGEVRDVPGDVSGVDADALEAGTPSLLGGMGASGIVGAQGVMLQGTVGFGRRAIAVPQGD